MTPEQQDEVKGVLLSRRTVLLAERYAHSLPSKEQVTEDLKNPDLAAVGIRRAAVGAQEKNYYVWQK